MFSEIRPLLDCVENKSMHRQILEIEPTVKITELNILLAEHRKCDYNKDFDTMLMCSLMSRCRYNLAGELRASPRIQSKFCLYIGHC